MEVKEKIKELRDKGIPIYSISRLNTVDNCGWEYWQTYMEHAEPKENIYSFAGTKIHTALEQLQNNKDINLPKEIEDILNQAEILDIHFPSDTIKDKWVKDIRCFAQDYHKKEYKKWETEKLFLFELGGKYLQGIIDLLVYNEDGTISIIDYKTSSKFSNKDLEEKGRQLILYGLAMEQMGYKVKDLAWNMLKYVEISYPLKNGKTKTVVAERGFILEKLKSDITKELTSSNVFTPLEVEEMVDNAVLSNSFDPLPSSIKSKYTIQDYMVYYDFTPERKIETQLFIEAKVNEIEAFEDDKTYWTPKEINAGTSFYCENLCNHRDKCEYLKEYQERMEYFNSISEEALKEKELEAVSFFT